MQRAVSFFVVVGAVSFVGGCGEEKIDAVENKAPVAVIVGANAASAGGVLDLAGSGSSDEDGDVVEFAWDFGDGSNGAGVTTQHIFNSAGTFTITLTVTDDDGATGVDTLDVVVDDNVPPVAVLEAVDDGSVGVNVHFDGAGSTDIDGTVVSFAWEFGDGSTATGPTFDHAFAAAGTFTVVLTVTDDKGATDEAEHDMTIVAAPPSVDGEWTWFLTDESLRDLGFSCGGSFQDSQLTILANQPNISVTEHAGGTNVAYSGTYDGTHFDAQNEQLGIVQSIIGDFTSTTEFTGVYRFTTGFSDCADRPVRGLKQ